MKELPPLLSFSNTISASEPRSSARTLNRLPRLITTISEDEPEDVQLDAKFIFEHELFYPSTFPPVEHSCANHVSDLRNAYKVKSSVSLQQGSYREFLAEFALHCLRCEVRRCAAPSCVATNKRMTESAPPFQWTRFRDWAITVMACKVGRGSVGSVFEFSADHFLGDALVKQDSPTGPLELASQPLWWLQGAIAAEKHPPDLEVSGEGDIFTLLQLVLWMAGDDITSEQYSIYFESKWMHGNLENILRERGYFWTAVPRAVEELASPQVCQKRVWDLAQSSLRQEHALPAIVELSRGLNMDSNGRHRDCTPQVCSLSDDNNTRKEQLHKCTSPKDCKLINFDLAKLEARFVDSNDDFVLSAWSLNDHGNGHDLVVDLTQPYMAISHVWSDGTGVGLRRPGIVNSCLFDFFGGLARQEGCKAIWWDVVCLPSSRPAKRRALGMMHKTYQRAKFVLVHDLVLANTVWNDDGSPALAMVLSDWFSRGWTALELWAGQSVKVLFRTSTGTPLLKDLKDILTPSPQGSHLAHSLASTLIRHTLAKSSQGLLQSSSLDISPLLHVLLPRTTSFPKDKMVVAGLMADVTELDPHTSPSEMTKQILIKQKTIESVLLLHDKVPMTQHGPWSWCPPSLLDFQPSRSTVDIRTMCTITPDGTISGEMYGLAITSEIAKRLTSTTAHIAARLRIAEALRNWQNCLLLHNYRDSDSDTERRFLLVVAKDLLLKHHRTEGGETVSAVLDCDYIGTVTGRVATDKLSRYLPIRMGFETTTTRKRGVAELMTSIENQLEWYWFGMQVVAYGAWNGAIVEDDPRFYKTLLESSGFVVWNGW